MKQVLILLFTCSAIASYGTSPGTPLPPDSLNCDTLWLKSGAIKLVTIISDNGSEIKFSECPPNEIVSTIPKSATKLSPRDSILALRRATLCDTIYLKGGEIETGHVKYYNGRKVVYTGCCSNCSVEKTLKRKAVDSIHYADGRTMGTGQTSDQISSNNTNTVEQNNPPEEEYTPEEKEKAKKRMKLFGILGLSSISVVLTGALLLILVATSNPVLFGLIFFFGVIAGLVFAMLYVRNKKKAGLGRNKK
ncbi:MAG: hypothetical protein HUJ25_11040 [Crocinitomicaceae bacterium]|nr:hypothetical protein [Crocinitomicaceae bacterium]